MNMIFKLNAPGMTSLHKVGLAGLYLTLRAFDVRGVKIPRLEWSLGPNEVSLHWKDENPKASFVTLIDKAFWVDSQGFIRLAGLEPAVAPTIDKKYLLYTAMLGSFLQYGKHRQKGKEEPLTYQIDEKVISLRRFSPILKFRHQEVVTREIFLDSKGFFKNEIEIPSWMYPGGVKRHDVYDRTALAEQPELALPLLFAPVGTIYYTIKSLSRGKKAKVALVFPDVQDLAEYAHYRSAIAEFEVLEMSASSPSDAALRFIAMVAGDRTSRELSALSTRPILCRVVTFGIVGWSPQQKTRTYARTIQSSQLNGLENYRTAAAIFKNRWQLVPSKRDRNGNELEPARHLVGTFAAREFIADNISQGKAWHHDLAGYLGQKEVRDHLLYEGKELNKMVQSAFFEDENERLFITVCQESWRRRLGKLGERARSENRDFPPMARKESEKLRVSLARTKNATSLRETVVDFWARSGVNPGLQGGGLTQLLPLFSDNNWRKARDLALLALISYQPQNREEETALTSEAVNKESDDE